MKLTEILPSAERCAEAGWYAWDFWFDAPVKEPFIRRLRELGGSFLYLPMLKQPFFKLENHESLLKGVAGDTHLRLALHESNQAYLETVKQFLEQLCAEQ